MILTSQVKQLSRQERRERQLSKVKSVISLQNKLGDEHVNKRNSLHQSKTAKLVTDTLKFEDQINTDRKQFIVEARKLATPETFGQVETEKKLKSHIRQDLPKIESSQESEQMTDSANLRNMISVAINR